MNWGKGITIVLICFMSFIGIMVYRAFSRNADLVREDYYENELAFDDIKQAKYNYTQQAEKIKLVRLEEGIEFIFPEGLNAPTEGEIIFYRPDKKSYDRAFTLDLAADHTQLLSYQNFREGYYDVRIEWTDGSRPFVYETSILF
jgi:hypothetical protein